MKKLQKQAKHYNAASRDLQNLKPGDNVRMQPSPGEKTWKLGKVVEEISPRKYKIAVDGKFFTRNRKYLRYTKENGSVKAQKAREDPSPETHIETESVLEDLADNENNPTDHCLEQQTPQAQHHNSPEPIRTQFGRAVKRPTYLNNYVS